MLGFFLDKMEEVNSRWNRVFYLSSSISGDWIVNVVRGFVYFFILIFGGLPVLCLVFLSTKSEITI